MIVLLLLWVSVPAHSDDIADLINADAAAIARQETFETKKMLTCIRDNVPNKLLSHNSLDKVDCMINQLHGALEASFIRHGMSTNEIALYLSQTLAESRFFLNLTETGNLEQKGSGCSDDGAALAQMIHSLVGDVSGVASTSKAYAGKHVGTGLLQLTGYDNKVSAVDWLMQRLVLDRYPPVWKHGWEFPTGKMKKGKHVMAQLKANTNDPKLQAQFYKWYKEEMGMDINRLELLTSSERMTTPGMEIKDKEWGTIPSAAIITELSMAYWKGACGDEMEKIANSKAAKSKRFGPKDYKSREEYLVSSATMCVKRKIRKGDMKTRTGWYRLAASCVKSEMPIHAERFNKKK